MDVCLTPACPFLGYSFNGSDSKQSTYNAGDPSLIPGLEDPLEKGMAAHSSILAWRIPWTEKPGGLSPWGHKESNTTELLTLSLPFSGGPAALSLAPCGRCISPTGL